MRAQTPGRFPRSVARGSLTLIFPPFLPFIWVQAITRGSLWFGSFTHCCVASAGALLPLFFWKKGSLRLKTVKGTKVPLFRTVLVSDK